MKQIIKDAKCGYIEKETKDESITTSAYPISKLIELLISKGVIREDEL